MVNSMLTSKLGKLMQVCATIIDHDIPPKYPHVFERMPLRVAQSLTILSKIWNFLNDTKLFILCTIRILLIASKDLESSIC